MIVSELCHIPPETPVKHRRLRGHADACRCCVKSLIRSALVGFVVRQYVRAESISKRAPSTTVEIETRMDPEVRRIQFRRPDRKCQARVETQMSARCRKAPGPRGHVSRLRWHVVP